MTYVAMTTQSAPPGGTPVEAPKGTPDDRATSFQPVEGQEEMRSGGTLLVAAYAVLWVILLVWIGMLWRKQGAVNARIDALEKEIDRAASKGAAKG